MFGSPFFGNSRGYSQGRSPYERAYAQDPYQQQIQLEQQRRAQEIQRRREAAAQNELAQRRRRARAEEEAAYEQELYEQELARRQHGQRQRQRQPTQYIDGYDRFGRPIIRTVPARAATHSRVEELRKRQAAAQAEAEARAEAEQERAARKKRAAAARRLRTRIAATKVQRWWREHLDRKYTVKPNPRIEEVDEGFRLPRHRILPDNIDFVVLPVAA